MFTKIIPTDNIASATADVIASLNPDKVFLLTDANVARLQSAIVEGLLPLLSAEPIVTPAGETHKNLTTLTHIWEALCERGATRRSLLICLGGGTITDMGGFAAACFKRGMRFVNIPTTLLGAVDAAVGGKTGVDFNGLKNEIGAFADSEAVIVSSQPYSTLPREEMLSGYAEIVKTALITPDGTKGVENNWYATLLDPERVLSDPDMLRRMVISSINAKISVVESDKFESGPRKALNFGHTVGHAYESLALKAGKPVPHGVAVAHGMMRALEMSEEILGLDSALVEEYRNRIMSIYPALPEECHNHEAIRELMAHDKKNTKSGTINFTLLQSPGHPLTDYPIPNA